MTWPFAKMHGLGNDFVVLDGRRHAFDLGPDGIRAIADRRTGVGCDQLVVLAPPRPDADIDVAFYNADGGSSAACGNATRCIAAMAMSETGKDTAVVGTPAGPVRCRRAADGLVSADMGRPGTDWQDIPLAEATDTLALPIAMAGVSEPVAVSMGNPHMVFFVADAEAVDLSAIGPVLEHHPLYPERANVEVCQSVAPDRLRMRVWERGAGITRACGTGACAAAVAARRRGWAGDRMTVVLDGGALTIDHAPDGHVWMTGPVATAFTGKLDSHLIDRGPT